MYVCFLLYIAKATAVVINSDTIHAYFLLLKFCHHLIFKLITFVYIASLGYEYLYSYIAM